jgi:hypothetical protein
LFLQHANGGKLDRKESYKAQRKNYRQEKKRVANELLTTLKDPAVIILADWLKVRGTLKSWTKLWCVLKPGLLLLYKSPKTKVRYHLTIKSTVALELGMGILVKSIIRKICWIEIAKFVAICFLENSIFATQIDLSKTHNFLQI